MKKFIILSFSLFSVVIFPSTNALAQTDGNALVEGEPDIIDLIENNPNPNNGIFGGILDTINPILETTKTVITEIKGGSLENAIYTSLGAIGLIDPVEEANSINNAEKSPYSNPESVESAIEQAEAADAQESQVSERLSQIIFGQKGQSAIQEQNEVIKETQQSSVESQLATAAVYEVTRDIAIDNYGNADLIAVEAEKAQAANASQDVLKAISAQNQYLAEINSGVSEQMALMTEAQIYNAVQMNGLNEQLAISNQRQQNVETFLASSNSQLSEIDRNQEEQFEREVRKENQKMSRSRYGISRVFIRGLFEEESQPTGAEFQSNLNAINEDNDSFFQ